MDRGPWPPVALSACLALAAGLRFFGIETQSLWFDEGISAYQLRRDWMEIVRAAAADTHPPLYYWTLKLWATVFGEGVPGLRSLSAVAGVGLVATTWLLGRRLFGLWPASVAGLLVAVSPLAVYYSQEVRMYAQVGLLALLAVYLAVGWLQSEASGWTRGLALYALLGTAALYTQYLGASVLIALNLYVLAVLAGRQRTNGGQTAARRLATWLSAQAVVVLLFLPWLPVFLDQLHHRTLNTSPRVLQDLVLQAASALTLGRAAEPRWSEPAVLGLLGLALVGLLTRRRWVTLAALLAVLPAIVVISNGLRSGLFEPRYLGLALPGLALLAGLGVKRMLEFGSWGFERVRGSGIQSPGARTAAALLLTVVLLAPVLAPTARALERLYFDPTTFRDDYRGLVEYLDEQAREEDGIILNAGNQWDVFSYYYRGGAPVYQLPARRPIDLDDTRQRLEAIRERHPRVWMVLWASREGDPQGFIEEWFAVNAFQNSHAWYRTVQLVDFSFAPPGDEPQVGLDARLDNGAHLLGYSLASDRLRPGDTLALTLFWQAEASIDRRYKVFVQLLDDSQQVVAQRDNEPVGTLRPTTTWEADETVVDNYGVAVPDGLPPGRYRLIVGMYRLDDGARPTIAESAGQALGDHLMLAEVRIAEE